MVRSLMVAFGLLLIVAYANLHVSAQTKIDVRFKPGSTMGFYNGSIRGERYIDYRVRAKSGQTLRVQLQKRSGSPAYFNVMKAGSEVAITDDAREVDSWKGVLPEDGVYIVRVYMAKADRLARRASNFKVGFSAEVE